MTARLPITERIQYKLCLLVHKMFVGHAADYIASLLTLASDIPSWSSLLSSSTVTWSYQQRVGRLVTGYSLCCRTRCLESAADRLETLVFDCFIQEQTEAFSVSCCLHREHFVNSGMRHRSDCRGHTTSHCCNVTVTVYCYSCCMHTWVKMPTLCPYNQDFSIHGPVCHQPDTPGCRFDF